MSDLNFPKIIAFAGFLLGILLMQVGKGFVCLLGEVILIGYAGAFLALMNRAVRVGKRKHPAGEVRGDNLDA